MQKMLNDAVKVYCNIVFTKKKSNYGFFNTLALIILTSSKGR